MESESPKYFLSRDFRHLLMTIEFFQSNTSRIEDILESQGFKTEFEVTRIDDHESGMVEFVQALNTGDRFGDSYPYPVRSGEGTRH